jgi:hypothetical protein
LNLYKADEDGFEEIIEGIATLHSLQFLNLAFTVITDSQLSFISTKLPNLAHLNLFVCSKLTKQMCYSLLKFPSLKFCNLEGLDQIPTLENIILELGSSVKFSWKVNNRDYDYATEDYYNYDDSVFCYCGQCLMEISSFHVNFEIDDYVQEHKGRKMKKLGQHPPLY